MRFNAAEVPAKMGTFSQYAYPHCKERYVECANFPVRLQTSIFGAGELNFRVRDGNGWTLTAINTNLLSFEKKSKQKKL